MHYILANNEQNESLDLSQINVHIAMPECVIEASAAETKISNSATSSTEEKEPNDELLGAEETIIMSNLGLLFTLVLFNNSIF